MILTNRTWQRIKKRLSIETVIPIPYREGPKTLHLHIRQVDGTTLASCVIDLNDYRDVDVLTVGWPLELRPDPIVRGVKD